MKTSSYLTQCRVALGLTLGLVAALCAPAAQAFCGFYVGKADSSLFNEASQVVIVRDGDKTVLSMLNDFKGDLKEFALVVPVPTVLTRGQINVGDAKTFARLDAYSAPRLAEYFDPNPCMDRRMMRMDGMLATMRAPTAAPAPAAAKALGVTVEAQYTIGEYDIVILSASQSDGLETWLTQSGYKIPAGAAKALKPYINQGLKFFVAKVNLEEQSKTGFTMLRPLQFAFESERFMLPIRLGMANAAPNKPQDLIVFALTKKGRVESSNYRTQMMPANMDLPPLIKNDFKRFYKDLFDQQTKREGYKSVFTEYFWDMGWCDPCAADPLSTDELKKAGVFWLAKPDAGDPSAPIMPGGRPQPMPRMMPQGGGAQPVMLTRLHVRYTAETFPEDLMFTETADRNNYQTRYVMRHPWKGNPQECTAEGGKDQLLNYLKSVQERQEKELNTLLSLTNWDAADTRSKTDIAMTQKRYADAQAFFKAREVNQPKTNWWDGLWGK